MARLEYEHQAARIEAVFAAQKVPARVWQAKVTPRFIRFDITTAMGTRLTKLSSLSEELAFSLGVASARVYREAGVLHVEVPRDTPRTVDLVDLCRNLPNVPANCAVLGIEAGGSPLIIRLDSPDVGHILLAGTTGSGKTVLMRTLLLSLAMHNPAGTLQFVLIDPKGRGFGPLSMLAHTWRSQGVAQDPAAAIAVLQAVVAEMERRDRLNRHLPRIVVAIDELADLIQVGGEPVIAALERLTQRGREAGIHVVAATQRPAATLVGGLMKANFPVRLVGSVVSPEDAKVASGVAGSNAEKLLGRGDFLLVAKGRVTRFQAAHADNREIGQVVALIRAGGRRRRQWTARVEGELAVPAPLPPRALPTVGEGTGEGTGGGTVPGDRANTYPLALTVDRTGMRAPMSPGTVPAPSPAASLSDLTNEQRLAALLPPGQYLEMRRPADEREREIMRLAYSIEGGRRPMCRRIYGLGPDGRVRVNSRVSGWLRELGINVGDAPLPSNPAGEDADAPAADDDQLPPFFRREEEESR